MPSLCILLMERCTRDANATNGPRQLRPTIAGSKRTLQPKHNWALGTTALREPGKSLPAGQFDPLEVQIGRPILGTKAENLYLVSSLDRSSGPAKPGQHQGTSTLQKPFCYLAVVVFYI